MKADIVKRLFRAIKDGFQQDLLMLANTIIDEELKKGHELLAKQLAEILRQKNDAGSVRPKASNPDTMILGELPMSRRYHLPMATLLPRELLQHHMVLPPAVEERFLRIEKEYASRERLAKFGLLPRKKILLFGPPGCGKTMGAERLAWNTGLPLMKVRFDSMISSYLGESAANLRSIFDATIESPRLLLLDECDFIAKSRTNGQDVGEVSRIVNTLLQLLEEYEAPGLLVAATNLDTALDKALFRRFDDVFEIPKPGREEIEKLLRMTLSAMEVHKDVNWPFIVELLEGCSAAQVVRIARDAAKLCILNGGKVIEQIHIEKSIAEIPRLG